jgi:anaerobic selenocysteine-containing dehydrogenase
MAKYISRRDLFKFLGGGAAGVFLTPVPWKLLDDLAIWTQNWSWVPKPLHGEIRTKFTTCSLCPAGCGVRARCVGDQPVSLAGVPQHPLSQGTLCPVGLGGHHLPYHPARAVGPVRRFQKDGCSTFSPVSREAAMASIAGVLRGLKRSGSNESVAVLDERPGRMISRVYREFLAGVQNGIYLVPPSVDGATLGAIERMMEKPYGPMGFDLEGTRTILSFGAPILDGWGTPGRVMKVLKSREKENAGKRMRIIQVETRQSRTASTADEWIQIKPGSEVALALGLVHVILREKLFDETQVRRTAIDFQKSDGPSYRALVERFTPGFVASVTGIHPDKVAEIAREIAAHGPAIVVGSGDPGGGPLGAEEEMAIGGLNLLLGNVGRAGGVLPRRDLPDEADTTGKQVAASEIQDVPDHSIRVLIIGAAESGSAFPWTLVEKKLVREQALIVSLSPFLTGLSQRAEFVVPAPAYLESFQEIITPFDSIAASFTVSAPLMTPPAGSMEPLEFFRGLAAGAGIPMTEAGTQPDLLKRRVEAIHKSGRGVVFNYADGKTVPMSEVASADHLWKSLSQGACWVDSGAYSKPMMRYSLLGKAPENFQKLMKAGEGRLQLEVVAENAFPLVLMPFGWRGAVSNTLLSPLMTKLYQESGLRRLSNEALLNPDTAKSAGLSDGSTAVIETRAGTCRVKVRLDAAVMPGVLQVAVGPELSGFSEVYSKPGESILSICNLNGDSTWRVTRAKVQEA